MQRSSDRTVDKQASAAVLDVSGIVVHAAPARAAQVSAALEAIDGVTVHAVSAAGKIVVTLETDSEARAADLCERVRALPGVGSVAMVYHQIETDPDQEV